MGGIEVDGRGRSSLPGLWAAGEAACTGAHGANRLASNSLLEAVVFGARVAADVADALANLPPARALLGDKIASSVPRSVNATESTEATLALRRLLWDEVGLVRNEAGLRRALSALDGIADAAPPEACDLWQEIQVGKLLAAAALERRESRGGHFRSDFPTARPEWQYRLALSWHDDGAAGRIAFERRPVTAGALAAGLGS
jgi:L-aspartate oxidase